MCGLRARRRGVVSLQRRTIALETVEHRVHGRGRARTRLIAHLSRSGGRTHQGTVYELAAKVTPLLVDVLDEPTADKLLVLRTLVELAEVSRRARSTEARAVLSAAKRAATVGKRASGWPKVAQMLASKLAR